MYSKRSLWTSPRSAFYCHLVAWYDGQYYLECLWLIAFPMTSWHCEVRVYSTPLTSMINSSHLPKWLTLLLQLALVLLVIQQAKMIECRRHPSCESHCHSLHYQYTNLNLAQLFSYWTEEPTTLWLLLSPHTWSSSFVEAKTIGGKFDRNALLWSSSVFSDVYLL